MKREILFKAKHIHALPENEWMEGKWVEGFLSGEDYINDGTYEYMIDPDTICQYTGLTDKKGKKQKHFTTHLHGNIRECRY